MQDDLREVVARALYGREVVPGAWLAADADTRVMYRRLADAAIAAARPVIERETRALYEPLLRAVDNWEQSAADCFAEQRIIDERASIRSATR